jgi:hypothetical protein
LGRGSERLSACPLLAEMNADKESTTKDTKKTSRRLNCLNRLNRLNNSVFWTQISQMNADKETAQDFQE